ncbi:hypothetical protein [Collinsella sp. TF12-2AT]|uniref:hypothetical protein n=1 Tax=Collinsella sp. TF12-2AT TaxID=2292337 RepID=UPI0018F2125D|nr:hypothetical protein [Collinsella sp. TF12-2AT]
MGNIVGIGAIAQVRQGDPKHDITVVFNRLSKSLFFHNHLPVTLMVLDEVLTIDTLWPNEMFQIQAGKTYQNKPVPYWQGINGTQQVEHTQASGPQSVQGGMKKAGH